MKAVICIRARFQACREGGQEKAASAAATLPDLPPILVQIRCNGDIRHILIIFVTGKFDQMAIPLRRGDPANIAVALRTFFVTSCVAGKRNLLQSDRSAKLFIEVLYYYRSESKYLLHEFVIMPDHFHLLLTIAREITIERAVQFIKGGFAFRAGKELGFRAPIWQRGFSEVRVYDLPHLERIREYIAQNPLRMGFASNTAGYPYSSSRIGFELDAVPQGLKPSVKLHSIGMPEGMP